MNPRTVADPGVATATGPATGTGPVPGIDQLAGAARAPMPGGGPAAGVPGADLPLRDIHPPPVPDWWPPAPGWWLLGLLLLALLVILSLWAAKAWRRRARRKQVLARLDALANEQDPARFSAELSILLRRVALEHYPRKQVASLSGTDWLRFLDEHLGKGGEQRPFRTGPGQVLELGPYTPHPQVDREALTNLAKDWLRRNL